MSDSSTKVEFDVQMTCKACVDVIEGALKSNGVQSYHVDLEKESVVVESSLPTEELRRIIEDTGRRAVVKGLGSVGGTEHLGAGVVMIDTEETKGVVRLVQQTKDILFDGTVDGLVPGTSYLINIHQLGDLSRGCESCGDVYAGLDDSTESAGRLGGLEADDKGRLTFRLTSDRVKLWEIIGRSMVIQSRDRRLACGIIARSAGLFQNAKRVCACDGVSVWDERDVPLAGGSRRQTSSL